MAFKAVKVGETFAETPNVAANEPEAEIQAQRNRYDLATALGIVRRMETSAVRASVFEEIKNKNAIYRLVDALYTKSGSSFFQPLILFAYMLKCVISMGPSKDVGAEAVSISAFDNEHRTIDRVAALSPDLRLQRLTFAHKHMIGISQLSAALAMVGALGRVWSFLRTLARTHTFMPSARIAAALACYIRLSHLFEEQPALKAGIVASNYSPEAVGMAAAAHRNGRRLIYANHAPVPANGPMVPPVYADCALFYGDEIRKTYESRSVCTAEVAVIGQPGTPRAMEWRDAIGTVGIFLTAGTKVDTLRSLIATVRVDQPEARIIIRQHPVLLLRTDFSDLALDDANTELTIGNPLDDEIAACDLVICGNSGVAMNVLSGGRPVAYLSSLDSFRFDANGFVESRLVLSVPWWTEDIYDRLKGFYQAPGWKAVMQSYDASYDADTEEMRKQASETLMRHVRGKGQANLGTAPQPRPHIRKLAG